MQRGLKDILMNHAELYERLRQSAEPGAGQDSRRGRGASRCALTPY